MPQQQIHADPKKDPRRSAFTNVLGGTGQSEGRQEVPSATGIAKDPKVMRSLQVQKDDSEPQSYTNSMEPGFSWQSAVEKPLLNQKEADEIEEASKDLKNNKKPGVDRPYTPEEQAKMAEEQAKMAEEPAKMAGIHAEVDKMREKGLEKQKKDAENAQNPEKTEENQEKSAENAQESYKVQSGWDTPWGRGLTMAARLGTQAAPDSLKRAYGAYGALIDLTNAIMSGRPLSIGAKMLDATNATLGALLGPLDDGWAALGVHGGASRETLKNEIAVAGRNRIFELEKAEQMHRSLMSDYNEALTGALGQGYKPEDLVNLTPEQAADVYDNMMEAMKQNYGVDLDAIRAKQMRGEKWVPTPTERMLVTAFNDISKQMKTAYKDGNVRQRREMTARRREIADLRERIGRAKEERDYLLPKMYMSNMDDPSFSQSDKSKILRYLGRKSAEPGGLTREEEAAFDRLKQERDLINRNMKVFANDRYAQQYKSIVDATGDGDLNAAFDKLDYDDLMNIRKYLRDEDALGRLDDRGRDALYGLDTLYAETTEDKQLVDALTANSGRYQTRMDRFKKEIEPYYNTAVDAMDAESIRTPFEALADIMVYASPRNINKCRNFARYTAAIVRNRDALEASGIAIDDMDIEVGTEISKVLRCMSVDPAILYGESDVETGTFSEKLMRILRDRKANDAVIDEVVNNIQKAETSGGYGGAYQYTLTIGNDDGTYTFAPTTSEADRAAATEILDEVRAMKKNQDDFHSAFMKLMGKIDSDTWNSDKLEVLGQAIAKAVDKAVSNALGSLNVKALGIFKKNVLRAGLSEDDWLILAKAFVEDVDSKEFRALFSNNTHVAERGKNEDEYSDDDLEAVDKLTKEGKGGFFRLDTKQDGKNDTIDGIPAGNGDRERQSIFDLPPGDPGAGGSDKTGDGQGGTGEPETSAEEVQQNGKQDDIITRMKNDPVGTIGSMTGDDAKKWRKALSRKVDSAAPEDYPDAVRNFLAAHFATENMSRLWDDPQLLTIIRQKLAHTSGEKVTEMYPKAKKGKLSLQTYLNYINDYNKAMPDERAHIVSEIEEDLKDRKRREEMAARNNKWVETDNANDPVKTGNRLKPLMTDMNIKGSFGSGGAPTLNSSNLNDIAEIVQDLYGGSVDIQSMRDIFAADHDKADYTELINDPDMRDKWKDAVDLYNNETVTDYLNEAAEVFGLGEIAKIGKDGEYSVDLGAVKEMQGEISEEIQRLIELIPRFEGSVFSEKYNKMLDMLTDWDGLMNYVLSNKDPEYASAEVTGADEKAEGQEDASKGGDEVSLDGQPGEKQEATAEGPLDDGSEPEDESEDEDEAETEEEPKIDGRSRDEWIHMVRKARGALPKLADAIKTYSDKEKNEGFYRIANTVLDGTKGGHDELAGLVNDLPIDRIRKLATLMSRMRPRATDDEIMDIITGAEAERKTDATEEPPVKEVPEPEPEETPKAEESPEPEGTPEAEPESVAEPEETPENESPEPSKKRRGPDPRWSNEGKDAMKHADDLVAGYMDDPENSYEGGAFKEKRMGAELAKHIIANRGTYFAKHLGVDISRSDVMNQADSIVQKANEAIDPETGKMRPNASKKLIKEAKEFLYGTGFNNSVFEGIVTKNKKGALGLKKDLFEAAHSKLMDMGAIMTKAGRTAGDGAGLKDIVAISNVMSIANGTYENKPVKKDPVKETEPAKEIPPREPIKEPKPEGPSLDEQKKAAYDKPNDRGSLSKLYEALGGISPNISDDDKVLDLIKLNTPPNIRRAIETNDAFKEAVLDWAHLKAGTKTRANNVSDKFMVAMSNALGDEFDWAGKPKPERIADAISEQIDGAGEPAEAPAKESVDEYGIDWSKVPIKDYRLGGETEADFKNWISSREVAPAVREITDKVLRPRVRELLPDGSGLPVHRDGTPYTIRTYGGRNITIPEKVESMLADAEAIKVLGGKTGMSSKTIRKMQLISIRGAFSGSNRLGCPLRVFVESDVSGENKARFEDYILGSINSFLRYSGIAEVGSLRDLYPKERRSYGKTPAEKTPEQLKAEWDKIHKEHEDTFRHSSRERYR